MHLGNKSMKRNISPGVKKLIPEDLQAVIWNLFDQKPDILPTFFDLNHGRMKNTLRILRFSLVPYSQSVHIFEYPNPLEDLRLVILKNSDGLLLKIRNKGLEESLEEREIFQQLELDFKGR